MQSMNHIPVNELPYNKPVKTWLRDRYGKEADWIWDKTVQNYNGYLPDLPNYAAGLRKQDVHGSFYKVGKGIQSEPIL